MGRLRDLGLCAALAGCRGGGSSAEGPPPEVAVVAPRWLAHPASRDPADDVAPAPALPPASRALLGDRQTEARAAAFYLYPTADRAMEIRQGAVSPEIDEEAREAVRYEASVLNGAARIWAPRYGQASLGALRSPGVPEATAAVEAAAADALAAFDEFLKESGGLPILLLGHGQGAGHLVHILKARFDGQPLAGRLVAAWLAGELVGSDTFKVLPTCSAPSATGCVASWATAARGAQPIQACGSEAWTRCASPLNTRRLPVACFNPLTGGGGEAPVSAHLGAGPGGGRASGLFFDFTPALVSAACDAQGILRIDDGVEAEGVAARDLAGTEGGDYHPQDVSLFYLNLRADAAARVAAWHARPR